MAIYRTIQISYWQDKFILSLTPEQKFFYIYLMTNSKTKQCGCYELPANIVSFETGYNSETVKKLFKFFAERGKILYDESNEEILLLNWFKYNPVGNINVLKCIIKELDVVKCEEFYFMICEKLESGILNENLTKEIQNTSRYQADYKQMVRNKHNTNTKHQHQQKEELPTPQKLSADEVIEGKSDIPLKIVGNIQFDYIKNDWNNFAQDNGLAVVLNLSDKRISNIKTRLTETNFEFPAILKKIAESPYLLGANDRNWKVNFDWIFSSTTNYLKILENNYRNNKQTESEITPGFIPARDNR